MGLDVSEVSRMSRDAQAQIAAKLAVNVVQQQKKRSKYGNQKETRGAVKLDSKKEARRFDELIAQERAGLIRALKLQPEFTLQEAFTTTDGERIRAIKYVADFSYERRTEPDATGRVYWLLEVEDVKSAATKTAQYKIKRKLFREKYGMDVREV